MNSFQLHALGYKKMKRRNIAVTRWFKNIRFKTVRFLILYRAGILNRPNGIQTLSLSNNRATEKLYSEIMKNLDLAA